MKEQFVPYEIAKQLKQKGFNEYCLGLYQKNKKLIYAKPNNVWNNFWTDDELTGKITKPGNLTFTWKQEEIDEERTKGNTFESCVGYAAPLWQQVIDWLDKKEIFCSAEIMIEEGLFKWNPIIKKVVDYEEFKIKLNPRGTKIHALTDSIEHALTLM